MYDTRLYKVWNDLWNNKTRTILIVLSIAVGLFAVGAIISARTILSTEMARSFAEIAPSNGIVRTIQPFDQAFVRAVAGMPQVALVDARRTLDVRAAVGQGQISLRLFAVEDYDHMRVDKIRPISGSWPPPDRAVLIERSALSLLGVQIGDTLSIELPGDRWFDLPVVGVVHDLAQVPAQFDGTPYGYITMETLAWLGEPHGLNELHIVAALPAGADPKTAVQQTINQVKSKAEKNGLTIPATVSVEPGMLPLDDILQAILLLMGVLGVLALFLSIFLIINTVSALLTQQKRQIGVIKAVGADTAQMVGIYLLMVTVYGILALLLAAPLGVIGARALSRFIASLFNFDLRQPDVPLWAVAIQVVVALLTPTLASLPMLWSNLHIAAAEAMRVGYQANASRRAGPLDRLLSGANLWFVRRVLSRPLLLSIRNTFRNQARLALTLITLTLGGAIFMGVLSVQTSLTRSLDDVLRWWNFDIALTLTRPYRAERVMAQAQQTPGVAQADVWFQLPARRLRPNGDESETIMLFAPRADSNLALSPSIVQGRWLLPDDENALVINTILTQKEPDIRPGDPVILKVMGREQSYRVVGVCMGMMAPMAYVNYEPLARTIRQAGQAGAVLVALDPDLKAQHKQMAILVEAQLERNGIHVGDVQTIANEREEAQASFNIIIVLLLIMAVLLAVVGGLGLAGSMSINVLERTREIGVLRAIGASGRSVALVFIREGVAIGVLSWALGAVLSAPLGRLLGDAIGRTLMGAPLIFDLSLGGVGLWLVLVIVLSAWSSALPARRASQLTVREILAYE